MSNGNRLCLEDPRQYDRLAPLVVLQWEAFYGAVAAFVPPGAEKVPELGSGTGVPA